MQTIWLNLGMAAVWYWVGDGWAAVLIPLSILTFIYSFAHDYHVDAQAYRDALAALESERRLS